MTLKDLLYIADEASDVIIYYNRKEYKGCLEDMNFKEYIKPLLTKKVMRIIPTKCTWHKEEYFNGYPYLEIELGDQ